MGCWTDIGAYQGNTGWTAETRGTLDGHPKLGGHWTDSRNQGNTGRVSGTRGTLELQPYGGSVRRMKIWGYYKGSQSYGSYTRRPVGTRGWTVGPCEHSAPKNMHLGLQCVIWGGALHRYSDLAIKRNQGLFVYFFEIVSVLTVMSVHICVGVQIVLCLCEHAQWDPTG